MTKSQVGLSNVDNVKQASKVDLDSHINDAVKHVTASERASWNAKETPEGAQAKANEALKQAKAYTQESASTLDLSNNPQMQSVQKLAQQAFQSGNKVKSDVVDSLLSMNESLPINVESDWNTIINNINSKNLGYIKSFSPGPHHVYSEEVRLSFPSMRIDEAKEIGWPALMKVKIKVPGIYRVEYHTDGTGSHSGAYSRIYIDGQPKGVERRHAGNGIKRFEEDFIVEENQTVEVRGFKDYGSYSQLLVKLMISIDATSIAEEIQI